MLDEQMPLCKNFTITAAFGCSWAPVTSSPSATWVESHRGILRFSAWVMRSRPILKFAVWDERNTIFRNNLNDEASTMLGDRPEPVIAGVSPVLNPETYKSCPILMT
jgi:hypothetical protein